MNVTVSTEDMHRASLRQIALSVRDVATGAEAIDHFVPARKVNEAPR